MKDEEDEEKKKNEDEKKRLDQLNDFLGEKLQNPEITPEQQEERLFLSGLLFERTEHLSEEEQKRKRKREREIEENRIIELSDGRKFTLKELRNLVVGIRQPYEALFPNDNEFFSEVFRLLGIQSDPKKYSKPRIVSQVIRRIIYGRFQAELLPALDHLNPIVAGGFRKYKLSQYMNGEGKKKVVQFRDEAIQLMKEFPDLNWYSFEKEYSKRFKLSFQRSLFDLED